jgi:broad specificity phosphatase PhoE
MAAMWQSVEGGTWDVVISSPLQRCRVFAEKFTEKYALPLSIEPRLREIGLGVWEGLGHVEVKSGHAEAYAAYKRDMVTGMPQGAESVLAFVERVRTALDVLAENYPQQRVLVVSHAVVMRAALTIALDAPPQALGRIRVDYASFLHLRRASFAGQGHWLFDGLANGSPS